ncbi:pyruvate decarboxylase 2-like [Hibiscus syriacus]|uniref:Pyruvate decarboxylase 2-like n=1 Tax=Hibiscus syriacus TaxID=106335 RepID=A0A6A2ZCJ5_HIBSY|nr:pyruvate decarboxylase 2-like [Hibiscus syriacus]
MEEKMSGTEKISWTRGKCLGKGSFGTVTLATNESDGALFAVKSVDLATCLPTQLESLDNEIRILRSLSSPYVVEYLGDDVTTSESQTTTYRNLHMEYLPGGTVADEAIVKSRLADVEEKILRWHTRCLVSALNYLHSEGIVHCDVKGKNVLVGHDSASVKLADFGSATTEIKNESSSDRYRSIISPRGSPLWMAPEVIRGDYQGPESDVWSLGCTVIEMVTGKPAWKDQGFNSLNRIANSDELPEIPTQLSEVGKDFVDKCLRRDQNQRWSSNQLLQHPFVASASAPNMIGGSSPRRVLDFSSSDFEEDENTENSEASARERMGKLATEARAIWELDGWVTIRGYSPESCVNCDEGTSTEYPESMRTEKERVLFDSFDDMGNSNTVVWQCGNYKGVKGQKWRGGALRCNCWADSSHPETSRKVELAVGMGELGIYRFCASKIQIVCLLSPGISYYGADLLTIGHVKRHTTILCRFKLTCPSMVSIQSLKQDYASSTNIGKP